MGTRNNPGKYDCWAKLGVDEPHFVLMGRDPQTGALVRMWANNFKRFNEQVGTWTPEKEEKYTEAHKLADDADAWCRSVGRTPRTIAEVTGQID